jgi:hypothetical protein
MHGFNWANFLHCSFDDELHTKALKPTRAVTVVFITLLFSLTLNLLTTTIVAPPSNASKWQMGFNSAFNGLNIRVAQKQK